MHEGAKRNKKGVSIQGSLQCMTTVGCCTAARLGFRGRWIAGERRVRTCPSSALGGRVNAGARFSAPAFSSFSPAFSSFRAAS